jgi:hypothetical protein
MMATTIMISTRVKADVLVVLIFIVCAFLTLRSVNATAGGLSFQLRLLFTLLPAVPRIVI